MGILALLILGVVISTAVQAGGNDTCYGSLGCFSNKWPWSEPLRMTPPPLSPEAIDIRFYLYTRNAQDRFYVKHPSDGKWDVKGSDFDGSRKTMFVIHGFTQIGNETLMIGIKDALLFKEDANVIIVDWGKGAAGEFNFLQVVSNTRVVGATLIQLLKYLIAEFGADPSRVHIVGFSMGAHIAGYVGKAIPKIARITALEAGQPLFEGYDAQVRLDLADAVFIDAIHTDGRPIIPFLGFGYIGPTGHVDFFVNGGWNQPGCENNIWLNVTSLADVVVKPAMSIYSYVKCPHVRAAEVFISSLKEPNCTFWGRKLSSLGRALSGATGGLFPRIFDASCDANTCSAMGYDSIHYPARGSFDVTTSHAAPFCRPDPKSDAVMASVYIA